MIPPHEAIRNLLGTYCLHVDAGDTAAVAELFADGAMLDEHGQEIARGVDGVTALWRHLVTLHDGSPLTRHLVASPVIEVDGDTAVCRSSFLVVQQLGPGRLEPVAAGRYRDTFSCVDGTWRFSTRQFFLDQTGGTSLHLKGM